MAGMSNDEMLTDMGTDGARWADHFCETFGVTTKDGAPIEEPWVLMVGWFANAIEAGRTAGFGAGLAAPRRAGE